MNKSNDIPMVDGSTSTFSLPTIVLRPMNTRTQEHNNTTTQSIHIFLFILHTFRDRMDTWMMLYLAGPWVITWREVLSQEKEHRSAMLFIIYLALLPLVHVAGTTARLLIGLVPISIRIIYPTKIVAVVGIVDVVVVHL